MIISINDFKQTWGRELENTSKMMAELTDKSLSQSIANDHRTLGRIAWHLTTAIPEMMERTGLKIEGVKADAPLPKTAAEIKNGYDQASKSLLEQVIKNWKDETLMVIDEMYGMKWPKGLTLRILMDHEIHHRGQMTVLMRQAGLKVPGVYGPSKDEWVNYGANPPQI